LAAYGQHATTPARDRRTKPMPANEQNPPPTRTPVLAKDEASRRVALLAELQGALAAQGIRSVLARRHRLVLSGRNSTTCEPSGPTDPELHIFTQDGKEIATARGRTYHFASGQAHPADDPARAAVLAIGRTACDA
jgi:hypothetical protein